MISNQDAQRIVGLIEAKLAEIPALKTPSLVFDGLAVRAKPAAKMTAREAFLDLLFDLHVVRLAIEASKPLKIVTPQEASTSQE